MLSLEMTEEVVDLVFPSLDQAEHWKDLIQQWKDYAIDFAALYGEGARIRYEESDLLNRDNMASSASASNPNYNLYSDSDAFAELDKLDFGDAESGNNAVVNPMFAGAGQSEMPSSSSGGALGVLSSWFGFKPKTVDAAQGVDTTAPVVHKPDHLEGWLMKKAGHGLLGAEWHKRYCRIDGELSLSE